MCQCIRLARPGSCNDQKRTRLGKIRATVFDGTELWGADADPTVKISIDAFEPYLESV